MFPDNTFIYDKEFTDIFEGMTSISALIKAIDCGSNDRKIIRVLYDKSKSEKNRRELSFLAIMARKLSFDLEAMDSGTLDAITSGTTHGGIVAICTKRHLENLSSMKIETESNPLYVLLEGIEDPYNFGYSVRSLYALGVNGIILPPRNWLEFSGTVARSSAGCSELADMYMSEPISAVNFFKEKGFRIICAGIRNSVSLTEINFNYPTLLIVGGEKRGISRKLLDLCDATVRIDYGREFKGSLPTASAVSVIAFEALRQKTISR